MPRLTTSYYKKIQQDLRIRVFAVGRPIREERILYNIKYDYLRDGHLLLKGSLHPFAYEPVTDEGSENAPVDYRFVD